MHHYFAGSYTLPHFTYLSRNSNPHQLFYKLYIGTSDISGAFFCPIQKLTFLRTPSVDSKADRRRSVSPPSKRTRRRTRSRSPRSRSHSPRYKRRRSPDRRRRSGSRPSDYSRRDPRRSYSSSSSSHRSERVSRRVSPRGDSRYTRPSEHHRRHPRHPRATRATKFHNQTQSVVCDDLGMTTYAVYSNPKADLKTKDRVDLLESLLGALYVDKGMPHCQTFCNVCFFPRLQTFIMNQDWNDPKSKLQQCCLTLRTMDGKEPDIPIYKWRDSASECDSLEDPDLLEGELTAEPPVKEEN